MRGDVAETSPRLGGNEEEQSDPHAASFESNSTSSSHYSDDGLRSLASPSSSSRRVVPTKCPHNPYKYVALSTQFVYSGPTRSPILARISVVDYRGNVLLDSFAYPNNDQGIDLRTAITGILPEQVYSSPSFLEVRAKVSSLIRDRIIIGHCLWNDLALLGIVHCTLDTRDVALFLPFHRTMKCFTATPLKHIVSHLMRRRIGFGFENPVEDARAALDLFRSYEEPWETVIEAGSWPCALPPSSHMKYFS